MKVGGVFSCFNNRITDLRGLPRDIQIGGTFYCYHNEKLTLQSLKELPDHIFLGRKIRTFS